MILHILVIFVQIFTILWFEAFGWIGEQEMIRCDKISFSEIFAPKFDSCSLPLLLDLMLNALKNN